MGQPIESAYSVEGSGPPLILIHGGGWIQGDKNDLNKEAQFNLVVEVTPLKWLSW